jgi:hypothetical protein
LSPALSDIDVDGSVAVANLSLLNAEIAIIEEQLLKTHIEV